MSVFRSLISYYKRQKLIRIFLQIFLVLLIYFSIRAWQSLDDIEGNAPVIVAKTIDGAEFDLRKHRSKPILVHFWATWCPMCQLENANIADLSINYQVITIASWSEGVEEVKAYLHTEKLDMPVIVDEDGEWAKIYGVKAVPTSFIVNGKGVIQFIEKGYSSKLGLKLRLWWAAE